MALRRTAARGDGRRHGGQVLRRGGKQRGQRQGQGRPQRRRHCRRHCHRGRHPTGRFRNHHCSSERVHEERHLRTW